MVVFGQKKSIPSLRGPSFSRDAPETVEKNRRPIPVFYGPPIALYCLFVPCWEGRIIVFSTSAGQKPSLHAAHKTLGPANYESLHAYK
jgi:hypothetical protein